MGGGEWGGGHVTSEDCTEYSIHIPRHYSSSQLFMILYFCIVV